jgi:integrase
LETQTIEKVCAGDGNLLNYAWLLKKKRGSADNTVNLRVSTLRLLQKKGVDLNNPESFETFIATEDLTKARKWQFVSCYRSYTKIMKIPWEPINVKYEPKEPFLPTHEEMNQLIGAASKRLAAFLQTALTTGARVGELCKLKWIDIDAEKNTVSINDAEKGSKNRTIKVPQKTIAMLTSLKKKHPIYVFNTKPCNVRVIFQNLRKRLAHTQSNPRFLQIHLHTFRHFYATEALRNTKNLSYVKYALGHKSITNTERYTHLVEFGNDKYYSAVATTVEEGRKLAEDGWTYFQEFEGVKVFRKPR